ncbi:hypothetical protein [Saccharibacillus kuerlensis]|uniref:Lipoprotein n=1 Tax=Saccharibacillus kuerlensis TaxID=459527 RepID=A0ABQ2L598_9BACL|nr:hypothetical protein [Saccharibacillus kuerlensis]GGO01015.1 hypothetical protein GCM10010969_22840 [Saccharibacillus kuerlensis]
MKRVLKFLILLLLFFLVACTSKNDNLETTNKIKSDSAANKETRSTAPTTDYVTLTYSEYAASDDSDAIKTQVLSYDSSTKKTEKIFQFDYTAQYPLAFYDKPNQLVYYTQRVGTDKEYGDQIFVRDLSKKKTSQLTENLFAVNYVIPSGDRLFFVANIKGEQAIRLGAIDLKTKKITLWSNDDTLVEAITLDHNTEKLYVSAYSLKQRNYSLAHQDGPVGQNNFKMPTYTVYETDFDLKEKKKLFSKNYWIRMLMNKKGHVIAFSDKEYNKGQVPSTVIDYNLKKGTSSESTWGTKRLQRGEANYSQDESKIYTLAIVNNQRGLFEYDVKKNKFTAIFKPKEGFINNMQVVKGSS